MLVLLFFFHIKIKAWRCSRSFPCSRLWYRSDSRVTAIRNVCFCWWSLSHGNTTEPVTGLTTHSCYQKVVLIKVVHHITVWQATKGGGGGGWWAALRIVAKELLLDFPSANLIPVQLSMPFSNPNFTLSWLINTVFNLRTHGPVFKFQIRAWSFQFASEYTHIHTHKKNKSTQPFESIMNKAIPFLTTQIFTICTTNLVIQHLAVHMAPFLFPNEICDFQPY